MNTPKTPPNPLVDQHPVDTLIHIQSVLALLQDYLAQTTHQPDITPDEAQVHTGHYAMLKLVNDALDFEIDRLDRTEDNNRR